MSEILNNWVNGLGFPGVLVIDGHIHIGRRPYSHSMAYYSVEETVEKSLAFMDANGVDAVCIQSGGYMYPGVDYRLGNDFLLAVCQKAPDRLIGFTGINPNDSLSGIIYELDRTFDVGLRCIKLINSYQENYPGDGPNLMAVYEYAAKHRMLVFNHSWAEDVIMKVSAEFPDTDFIFGHYGNRLDPILKARKNVYANIWSYSNLGWLDRGIKNVGAEKFTFGSDALLNPFSVGIGPVVFAPITDDEKRLILGLTIARLLNNVGALPAVLREKYLR